MYELTDHSGSDLLAQSVYGKHWQKNTQTYLQSHTSANTLTTIENHTRAHTSENIENDWHHSNTADKHISVKQSTQIQTRDWKPFKHKSHMTVWWWWWRFCDCCVWFTVWFSNPFWFRAPALVCGLGQHTKQSQKHANLFDNIKDHWNHTHIWTHI